jgi:CDGSH-type Zn-finger protein
MARLVEHDAEGPRKLDESDIDPEKGDIAICQCGLSGQFPFCDGTHRETESEDDACYRYVDDGDGLTRREVDSVVYADERQESGRDEDGSG